MNWMILISGLAAGFVNLGHFTVDRKDFLKPMLQADFVVDGIRGRQFERKALTTKTGFKSRFRRRRLHYSLHRWM
jgi:hypothetical protein